MIPSESYAPGGATLQTLLSALSTDIANLQEGFEAGWTAVIMVGCQVMWKGQRFKFATRFCGSKGDWPYLRSAYRLRTGFTSKRICHICEAKAT